MFVNYEIHGEDVAIEVREVFAQQHPTIGDLRRVANEKYGENSGRRIPKEYSALDGNGNLLPNTRTLGTLTSTRIQFFPVTAVVSPASMDVPELMDRIRALENRNTELEAIVQRVLTEDTVALRRELGL